MAKYVVINIEDKNEIESFLNHFESKRDNFVSGCGGGSGCGGHVCWNSCGGGGCGSSYHSYGSCGGGSCGASYHNYYSGCGGGSCGGGGC